MLNPMGRTYQGYTQASQSILEELDGEEEIGLQDTETHNVAQAHRVSWDEAPRRPGQRQTRDNRTENIESSDDEGPQSFMIEAAPHHHNRPRASTNKQSHPSKSKGKETLRLTAKSGSSKQPILPVTNDDALRLPPRPSEIDHPVMPEPLVEPGRKQMRGLDAYERALWNWVNVYDLDVFLQDAYRYYEGKGIYCIALSRGLHLL